MVFVVIPLFTEMVAAGAIVSAGPWRWRRVMAGMRKVQVIQYNLSPRSDLRDLRTGLNLHDFDLSKWEHGPMCLHRLFGSGWGTVNAQQWDCIRVRMAGPRYVTSPHNHTSFEKDKELFHLKFMTSIRNIQEIY